MSGSKVDAKVVLLGKEYGGAAYGAKRVEVSGKGVVLGIWDTAGSERYQAMSRIYYRNAWAAVLCYDLTDSSSWDRSQCWAAELKQMEPEAHLYFVGTKKDLLKDDPSSRQIYDGSVELFAEQFGDPVNLFETSSKTGEGVHAVFEKIARDFATGPLQRSGKSSRERVSLSDWRKPSEMKRKCRC